MKPEDKIKQLHAELNAILDEVITEVATNGNSEKAVELFDKHKALYDIAKEEFDSLMSTMNSEKERAIKQLMDN